MTIRTTRRTVTFSRAFRLTGMDSEAPAGCYAVETDEELLESLSFPAYRRIATYLTVPQRDNGLFSSEMIRVDPAELEATARPGGEAAPDQIVDQTLPSRRAALRRPGSN